MMQPIVASTIAAFLPAEWNRLFPGELEDWSYCYATETARIADLEWLYIGVRVRGELRAVVPAFVTQYRLDTTLEGRLRSAVGTLARAVPRLLRPRMLSLGSPVAETCQLGFAPDAAPTERRALFDAILDACEAWADGNDIGMLAVKDAGEQHAALWELALGARGLRRQPGLATATLALPFATFDDYLASLGGATRKDLRRKLRAREQIRIEWRQDLGEIRDDVMRLYRATLGRAAMRLEELTPEFFDNVLAEMGGRASCVCYWHEGSLVAFNLVLHDGQRMIDKYIGMDYQHARRLNLYYLSWMENVRRAIEHRIPIYQSGQGLPQEKLRLGSSLSENGLWYRHRNRFMDCTLQVAERAFGLHEADAGHGNVREARA